MSLLQRHTRNDCGSCVAAAVKIAVRMVGAASLVVLAQALPAQTVAGRGMPACSADIPYVSISGTDTNSVAWVRFTDSTFDSRTRAVELGAFLRFTGRRNGAGGMQTLHLEMWRAVADTAGPPGQIADLEVRTNEIVARVAAPSRGVQMQRDTAPAGTLGFMVGQPLFLELIQRQVRPAVHDSAHVRLLWLFSGGQADEVTVRRIAADKLTLDFPGMQYQLVLAADGSIASGTNTPRSSSDGGPVSITRSGCK